MSFAPLRVSVDTPLVKTEPHKDDAYRNWPAPHAKPLLRQMPEEIGRPKEERSPDQCSNNDRWDEPPERELQEACGRIRGEPHPRHEPAREDGPPKALLKPGADRLTALVINEPLGPL